MTTTISPAEFNLPELLDGPQVRSIVGLSRSYIYSLIADERFPAPRKLGYRKSVWLKNEIQEWLEGVRKLPRAVQPHPWSERRAK